MKPANFIITIERIRTGVRLLF